MPQDRQNIEPTTAKETSQPSSAVIERDRSRDLEHYCKALGISMSYHSICPNQTLPRTVFVCSHGVDSDTGYPLRNVNSFYRKIRNSFYLQSFNYYSLLYISIVILTAQVVFSATSSVLAASNKNNRYDTAIVVLGAVTTVISFFAGFIKSMGQPTRARQLRDAYANCWNSVDETIAMYRLGTEDAPENWNVDIRGRSMDDSPHSMFEEAKRLYEQARRDGMANMPDVWVAGNTTVGGLAKHGPPA